MKREEESKVDSEELNVNSDKTNILVNYKIE